MKKNKLLYLTLSSFYLLNATPAALAANYYSSQIPNGGYTSDGSGYTSSNTNATMNGISVSVQWPHGNGDRTPYRNRYYHNIFWVNMMPGQALPEDAVIGGMEHHEPLYICHADFSGGIHPGKIVAGKCNIAFGGNEIRVYRYQVLVSHTPLRWQSSRNSMAMNAVIGGEEHNHPLYICQAQYHGGVHPGKIVNQLCHISWGGREIATPDYNVLVK